jgi:CRP-like cAMP-binding protein
MSDTLMKKFTKTYAPGDVICREGEEGDEMYIVQKGKVRVSKNFAGKIRVIAVIEKGDFIGETAIVNRVKRTATVTAIDEVQLLALDREGLVNTITKNAKIGLAIIDKLCRRLRDAHLTIHSLVKKDETGLIALQLSHLFREMPGGEPSIPHEKAVDEVSLSLELPRESVEHVLDRIAAAGITVHDGDAIVLKDRDKLLALAE